MKTFHSHHIPEGPHSLRGSLEGSAYQLFLMLLGMQAVLGSVQKVAEPALHPVMHIRHLHLQEECLAVYVLLCPSCLILTLLRVYHHMIWMTFSHGISQSSWSRLRINSLYFSLVILQCETYLKIPCLSPMLRRGG